MELFISAITTLISFLLALFVFFKNRKSATNVYLAGLLFFIGFYPILNYLSIHAPTSEDAFFWAKFIIYFAIPVGPLYYFFVNIFPKSTFIFNKKVQVFIIMWTFLNIILNYLNLIFKSVSIVNSQPSIHPGPAIASFGILQVFSIIAASWILIKKYKKAEGPLKQQLRYISYGIIISLSLTVFSTVILVFLFGISTLVPISPIFLLFAGISTSYAIVRHKFLDIGFVVARSVSYSLLIFFLGLFYSAGFFIVKIFITKEKIEPANLISSTIIALIIAFSFQPMRKILEKITAKIFFKDSYSANVLLQSLSRIMASTLFLSDMTALILRELLSNMKVSFGYIVLIKDQKIIWKHAEGTGFPSKFNNDEILFLVRAIVLILKESSFNIDDLPESREKTIMHEHGFNIILPLVVKDEIIGVVLLGEKASGSIYSAEDINVLKILAPEVAVGVKNALAYEEIKNFNVTLANEVKQATENLTQANNRLRELDVLKTEFVSLASHELRTPMTAIKSYLWMALAGRGGPLTEKQKFYLDRAYNSTDRLIKLVNDMLNISRIESGRLTLEMQKVDLQLLTQDVIDEIMPRSQELGVTIALHKASGIPEVIADPNKIKEVLLNLIGNSLKFTPKNGIVVISFSHDDTYVTTKVTDTGSGIDPEDMSKLFQKFGFVQGSYTVNQTASQGTGLGLYISKSIVELHKGKITAYSEGVHKGSTFTFSLMIYHEDDMRQFRELTHDQVRNPVELIHTQI